MNPRYLARFLLNTELAWPECEEDDRVFEIPRRLEDLMSHELIDVLFFGGPGLLTDRYGERGVLLPDQFRRLGQELRTLRRTDRVDREMLRSGGEILDRLIADVRDVEESVRRQLDPNSEVNVELAMRATFTQDLDEAIRHSLPSTYLGYLQFRCAGDALETLRDGLREINEALDRQPPSSSRA